MMHLQLLTARYSNSAKSLLQLTLYLNIFQDSATNPMIKSANSHLTFSRRRKYAVGQSTRLPLGNHLSTNKYSLYPNPQENMGEEFHALQSIVTIFIPSR